MISSNIPKELFISPSELDDKLMADKDGHVAKGMIEKLETYANKVRTIMNKGELAPNEFEAAQQMLEGIKQATEIIKDRIGKQDKK